MSSNEGNSTPDGVTTQTHVYVRDVKGEQDDSLAKIAALVPRGSTVLDVGTGSGALGQHLSSNNDCIVDGITYNQQEAALAKPHYRRLLVMDLERQALDGCFGPALYDVIVCADVLEHLRNASDVLRALSGLLKPDGIVLVSIPNVTHLGVILSLMAGRFVRTREGLLDSTHVHFMDRVALRELVESAGFQVAHEAVVQRNLVQTEFAQLNFQALPPVVRAYVQALPDASVYQFVWMLTPRLASALSGADGAVVTLPDAPLIGQVPRFRAQLFLDRGQGFSEDDCIEAFGVQSEGVQTLVFPMAELTNLQAMRLDFADRPGQMEFVSLVALDDAGQTVWSWFGEWAANLVYHQCDWTGARGWFGGRVVRAIGHDPWVRIPLNDVQWTAVRRVVLSITSPQPLGSSDWPGLDVRQIQRSLQNLSVHADQNADELLTVKRTAELIKSESETLRRELSVSQELAQTRLTDIENLNRALAVSQGIAALRANQLNALLSSHSWRLTAGLRWLAKGVNRMSRH